MSQGPARIPQIHLNDKELEELERLSALGYTPPEMALYFAVHEELFIRAAADPNSTINYHIRRGALQSVAKEQLAILLAAEGGNITAAQQLERIRRNRGFEISKLDIFGGFDDPATYQHLQDFIESGAKSDISKEEQIYLEALTLISSMDRKYGRRKTVAFFTKPPFNFSHSRASEMHDEAMNLFYTDRNIEKKALRNKYAEQLDEAADITLKNATTSRDMEIYGDLKMKAAKLRQLDQKDPEPLSKELYLRPVRVFTLDPSMIGMETINRQLVASQIDELEVPEREKIRLRKEAMLDIINLEETLNELEEESRSR